jgi:predicted 3-demethylubiquinone-9 3-methyltransferase (glyoxalase superfamily)
MNLITCLWFDGRAREAATFYTSIFPESALDDNWIAPTDTPGNKQGEEIVVNFQIFGRPFIALNGGPQFPHSEAISFQIPCANQSCSSLMVAKRVNVVGSKINLESRGK